MYLNEENLHEYRFVRVFDSDELEKAFFKDDYSKLQIGNNDYYIKWGFPGQFKEADSELPDIDEWTVILRVFSEENWLESKRILAIEQHEGVKNGVAIPLSNGDIGIYSNDENVLVRTLSREELQNVLIAENGVFVKIEGETFIVNYTRDDDIHLRPVEGYGGDAKMLDSEQYKYYSLNQWLED